MKWFYRLRLLIAMPFYIIGVLLVGLGMLIEGDPDNYIVMDGVKIPRKVLTR